MATEAAWLNGNNLEKEEINTKKEKEEKQLIALTLTGLLMEGGIRTAGIIPRTRHLLTGKIVVKKARREWLCGLYRGGVGDLWINFNAGDGFGMPGWYAQRRASSAHMRSSRSCI